MCWATPSSSDNSPMVLNAPGSLPALTFLFRDLVAHDLAGAERHHPARRDRHFDAGLGIAADPLALVAQDEAAEARNLDVLPFGQSVAHMMEDALDDPGRFGPGQSDFAVHDVSEIRPGERAHGRFSDRT